MEIEKDIKNMTNNEIETLYRSLFWEVDDLITNDFGERVWLKPLIVKGKRIGITDCCFEGEECEYHKKVKENLCQPK